jgi:hypothetical protein
MKRRRTATSAGAVSLWLAALVTNDGVAVPCLAFQQHNPRSPNGAAMRTKLVHRRTMTIDRGYGDERSKFERVFGDPISGIFTLTEELQLVQHWGLTKNLYGSDPKCPASVEDVVDGAFAAIAGTLCDRQKPDPAVTETNRDPSLFAYRPVRSPGEAGRIGIEIDGAECLFPDLRMGRGGDGSSYEVQRRRHLLQSRAQRRLALLLAMKLASNDSWTEFEAKHHANQQRTAAAPFRPVALSFNTLKEALAARREMQHLQTVMDHVDGRVFDHIIVQTISDGLPNQLQNKIQRKRFARMKEQVNATKGILLLCSPTDFSHEYEPPGPSLHTISDFQKTIAVSLLHETPVVVISPRFFSYDEGTVSTGSSFAGSINQNVYQQAGYYGGKEPPRGMSPWVLRDFFPPSYCWIGDALADDHGDEFGSPLLPRVIITNSVMEKVCTNLADVFHGCFAAKSVDISFRCRCRMQDYPWHIFAGEERYSRRHGHHDVSHGSHRQSRRHHGHDTETFHYLGSTRSISGRPTRALLQHLVLTNG